MQGEPIILVIGRENPRHRVDIAIPSVHNTVSARHAQISVGPQGDLCLTDLGSANGTFIQDGEGKWVGVGQASIRRETRILLGDYQTTGEALLNCSPQAFREIPIVAVDSMPAEVAPPPPVRKPRGAPAPQANNTVPSRYIIDPETGQVVKSSARGRQRIEAGPRRDPETGEMLD